MAKRIIVKMQNGKEYAVDATDWDIHGEALKLGTRNQSTDKIRYHNAFRLADVMMWYDDGCEPK